MVRITTQIEKHNVRRLYNCHGFEENWRGGGRGRGRTRP